MLLHFYSSFVFLLPLMAVGLCCYKKFAMINDLFERYYFLLSSLLIWLLVMTLNPDSFFRRLRDVSTESKGINKFLPKILSHWNYVVHYFPRDAYHFWFVANH